MYLGRIMKDVVSSASLVNVGVRTLFSLRDGSNLDICALIRFSLDANILLLLFVAPLYIYTYIHIK